MRKYTQLSQEERAIISDCIMRGWSMRETAIKIGRSTSTISREYRRNKNSRGFHCYYPQQAQEQSRRRKAKYGFKVDRIEGLKAYTLKKLREYWSPIAIAGRWSLDFPHAAISHEAIYAWIYGKEAIAWLAQAIASEEIKKRIRQSSKV